MKFRRFSFKWWWYGQVEDLHIACAKELQELEKKELDKGHSWVTPEEDLRYGWYSIPKKNLHKDSELSLKGKRQKKLSIAGPYCCIWESPEHVAIRCRYGGKIFQRRLSYIPQIVGVLGGLFGITAFIMQFTK